MNLFSVFSSLKKKFTVVKKIEFKDLDFTFYLEPLTSGEEIKALEACKDFADQPQFFPEFKKITLAYGIKQINDIDLRDDTIQYETEDGQKVSKYIYFRNQIEQWPAVLRDRLFEGFNDMQNEAEERVRDSIKFEKFMVRQPAEYKKKSADVPEGYSKVSDVGPEMTATEKLSKQATEEVERAQQNLGQQPITNQNTGNFASGSIPLSEGQKAALSTPRILPK
jgi:hypothetical protein